MNEQDFKDMVRIWEKKTMLMGNVVFVLHIKKIEDGQVSFCMSPYQTGKKYLSEGKELCLN